ncbi:MAG: hypothetical protein M3511_08300, partial [Deinococcota bacterium]|nr:hypothetical protein [Deinococcota bacterium]
AWQERFVSWTQALEKRSEGEVVSFDGKRLRGSACKGTGKAAIHPWWAKDSYGERLGKHESLGTGTGKSRG